MIVLLRSFCRKHNASARIIRRDYSEVITRSGGQDWIDTDQYFQLLPTRGKSGKKRCQNIIDTKKIGIKVAYLNRLPGLVANVEAEIDYLEQELKVVPPGSQRVDMDLELQDKKLRLLHLTDVQAVLTKQVEDHMNKKRSVRQHLQNGNAKAVASDKDKKSKK